MSTLLDGIDLSFRPKSYFWPLSAKTHLLATIKGAARRAEAERLIASGDIKQLDEFIAASKLSEEDRQMWGRIHPSFMGGEYLPDRADREIEIARITIASTTMDVTGVYARIVGKRIAYRVVDEYGGDTLSNKGVRTSLRPLSLGQLEQFFISAWRLDEVVKFNELDQAGAQAFVSPSSSFYPQFSQLIRRRIKQWIPETEEELEEEDERDEEEVVEPA
jgi:hypothetical protein